MNENRGSLSFLNVDVYRSSPWDSYGTFRSGAGSYSWNAPVQTSMGQQQSSATKGMTQVEATNSIGEGIKSMPNFNNFVQGMKIGYQGVKDTLGPFLSYRKAKQQKAILGMQAELLDMQRERIRRPRMMPCVQACSKLQQFPSKPDSRSPRLELPWPHMVCVLGLRVQAQKF